MCGIAGYIQRADSAIRPIERMNAAQKHRGPDGEGTWGTAFGQWHIDLGHRRLAIIDLAGGAQPMCDGRRSLHITFNGEIFNFQGLRRDLVERGCTFASRSDTEVILQLFASRAIDSLSLLNGMFAFAIWDHEAQTLTLARDRAGIKPLYYAPLADGGIAFASELSALLQHPSISTRVSRDAVASLFFRDYVSAPATILRSVSKLPPGHFLQWSPAGMKTSRAFWSGMPAPGKYLPGSIAACEQQLDQLITEAVSSQLVSDVPVGVFLSGGIDSSLVAAVAQKMQDRPIHTFSIGFEDPDYDESPFARRVAQHLGTTHIEQRLGESDLLLALDEALEALDEPMADPSILPTCILSKLASQHVKVALGGDGGDELWAGYPTYKAHRIARSIRLCPDFVIRRIMAPLVSRLPVQHGYQKLDWKLKRFFVRWQSDLLRRHQRWMSTTDLPELQNAMPAVEVPWTNWPDQLGDLVRGDELNQVLAYDFATYLPGSVLTKVDRASMRYGLEVRPPLLDNRLIDFAFAVSSKYKLRGATSKWLFKRVARRYLPGDIVNRKKKGFAIPLSRWLAGPLLPRLHRIFRDSPLWDLDLIRREVLASWLKDHFERRQDHSKSLWALITLDAWYRNKLHPCIAERATENFAVPSFSKSDSLQIT